MKALTICQPYAHMIIVTREKRVENRTWWTNYRGDLLIHAATGRGRLRGWPHVETWVVGNKAATFKIEDQDGNPVVFGALIGVAKLVDCVHIDHVKAGHYDDKFPWLRDHAHAVGPWCWVLSDSVIQFPIPTPMRGRLGLFEVPTP